MRNVLIITSLNIITFHSRYRYFWLTLCKWCGTADYKLFHIELEVFRLTEGKLELLVISVYLFWSLHGVTHISLHHSWKVGVKMNYTQSVLMLI